MNITLFLIPNKGGKAFTAPDSSDCCLMDMAVVDEAEMVCYIEEMLGIHKDTPLFNVRLCQYYRLLRNWLELHPENTLCESFQLAHLSTARQLLIWRDELKMAQWDFSCADTNTRLGAIAGVEKCQRVEGLPDRIIALIDTLAGLGSDTFRDKLRIILPIEKELMHPLLARLIDSVAAIGAKIEQTSFAEPSDNNLSRIRRLLLDNKSTEKIELKSSDNSFSVLKFEDELAQDDYMTICQADFGADIIINADTKKSDNRLMALNMPTVGSRMTSRSRIVDMMSLALSLYDEHLQILHLVEWFTTPVHPLPRKFRYELSDKIAKSGGFMGSECLNIIDKYLDGQYEIRDEDVSEEEFAEQVASKRKQREDNVSLFIPYMREEYRKDENAERTLAALASWARKRINFLREDENRDALAAQLATLSQNIDTLMMLFSERDETFSLSLANEWAKEIPMELTIPQHPARIGCTFTVTNPWDITTPADHIVWSHMRSGDPHNFNCSFLLPGEREALADHATFWERDKESRFQYRCSILPFLYAKKRITLSYAKKDNGEKVVPHPLITRLSIRISNFKEFCTSDHHEVLEQKKAVEVIRVDNSKRVAEYHFENADQISFPKQMSATGLETFTMHPFDFMFERILDYRRAGLAGLPKLETTRGTVAHATIQELFTPTEGEEVSTAEAIRKRFEDGYDNALQNAINKCGAIFMLPENSIELSNLKHQLRRCINNLLTIIADNNLVVNGCEEHYQKFVGISGESSDSEDPDMHGFLDMHLTDAEGNPVVFDMKWSKSPTFHRNLLEKNRSSQLAVYSELLHDEKRKVKTAYFVMPYGRLHTYYDFIGNYVNKITPENNDDIFTQLINSYRYRCEQLRRGVLEEGSEMLIEELEYGQAIEGGEELFPLAGAYNNEEAKESNRFSNFKLFKGF